MNLANWNNYNWNGRINPEAAQIHDQFRSRLPYRPGLGAILSNSCKDS